jgi:hypothetical protein
MIAILLTLIGCLGVFLAVGVMARLIELSREEEGTSRSDADAQAWLRSRKKVGYTRSRFPHIDPPAKPPTWTPEIVRLAEAYTDGADCGFALHDALMEAGKPELAEPFRQPGNPEGQRVANNILSSE